MKKIFLIILLLSGYVNAQNNWVPTLEKSIREADNKMEGDIGVYIKNLADNRTLNYNTNRNWYFSSTIKIFVAIAVLQKVEAGEIALTDKLTLKRSDYVDGSGDILWHEPGTAYTVATLINKMIKHSDSSATDMLIRLIGEEEFNRQIKQHIIGEGVNTITPIMQVRYDVYSEIHPDVKNFTNMDIVRINSGSTLTDRWNSIKQLLKVDESQLRVKSIDEAFDKYYKREINSGKLQSVGTVLERLVQGELLNKEHADLLLKSMAAVTTGERRLKAGFPTGTLFQHKTGTQIRQACDVGIVHLQEQQPPIIIAVCMRNFNEIGDAEKAFEEIASSLTRIILP